MHITANEKKEKAKEPSVGSTQQGCSGPMWVWRRAIKHRAKENAQTWGQQRCKSMDKLE